MEHDLVLLKFDDCRHDSLVASSGRCRATGKKRRIFPSCAVRPMVAKAASRVDQVIPRLSVRLGVLSFPWPSRMPFAARPESGTVVQLAFSRRGQCTADGRWIVAVSGEFAEAVRSASCGAIGVRGLWRWPHLAIWWAAGTRSGQPRRSACWRVVRFGSRRVSVG